MEGLYEKYGATKDKALVRSPHTSTHTRHRGVATRAPAVAPKNTAPQVRSGTQSYIASQKHNKLQEALWQKLVNEYGEDAVVREENWVDVKLVLQDEIVFYEVKSASYASDCIKQALGQVLGYVFNDKDARKKRIVVVGHYQPNECDKKFIKHIKSLLNIEFDYENIAI